MRHAPRSPFGSHVAERLLDALGRHALEGDADTAAEAEQVRSSKMHANASLHSAWGTWSVSDFVILALAPVSSCPLHIQTSARMSPPRLPS